MNAKTAETRIAQAINENAAVSIDHQTRAFIGFRFQLSDEDRATVVRVHKSQAATLLAIAA